MPLAASAASNDHFASSSDAHAYQAADILQVRSEFDRLLSMSSSGGTEAERTALRLFILRKLLLGFLDVRQACNKVEIELAYTYGVLMRAQRKQAVVNEFLNTANFAQLSALYTIEPYSRIDLLFKQSAVLTCVSAGVGTGLPVLGILYNKHTRIRDAAPAKQLRHVITGGPVEAANLPPLVQRYMDANNIGSAVSRKQEMYALWKKRYGVDATKESQLCSLNDNRAKSDYLLNTRMVLLWSLHTYIQEFDNDLFALLQLVRSSAPVHESVATVALPSTGAAEAARLLHATAVVEELLRANAETGASPRRAALQVQLLEAVLSGMLQIRIATDKVDEELNYNYDVVLSSLLSRRGKWLQRNFEANFIQTGVFGAIAGLLFLKEYPKAGNEIFIVQSGVGLLLTALGVLQMHGGWRKIDTHPNSLAGFWQLGSEQYQFPKLISDFLNSPSPESNKGQSRRELIIERWKKRHVADIGLDSERNRNKLAAMPSVKYDDIAVVKSRIELLHSLKARLEEFDTELYDLVQSTESPAPAAQNYDAVKTLGQRAAGMAKVIDVEHTAVRLPKVPPEQVPDANLLDWQLYLVRKIMLASLDSRKSVDKIDLQIAIETTARHRLMKIRDLAITTTNNANFFQLDLLGIISDGPLGLSSNPLLNYRANRLNIKSGYLVGILAGVALGEQSGIGLLRLTRADPNALGNVFGMDMPVATKFSPTVLKFLNSVAPTSVSGKTRAEELNEYWRESKITTVNNTRQSTREKLAAFGPSHHFWSERINLLNNRIRMLYDLRAVVDLMNVGLADLLVSIDE